MCLGTPPGPWGGAEAGVRRAAPNGGRSGAPRARRCAQTPFSMVPTHREKNVQLLSTEVRATQQNSRYSAKNNVAMRLIVTFMPHINEIFCSCNFKAEHCIFSRDYLYKKKLGVLINSMYCVQNNKDQLQREGIYFCTLPYSSFNYQLR